MALHTDLYDLLQPIIGGVLIIEDTNKARPPLPYSSFKTSTFVNVNNPHYGDVDVNGMQQVHNDTEFTLTIQHYLEGNAGNNYGVDVCSKLQLVSDKLRLQSNINKFAAKGVFCTSVNTVLDTSFAPDGNRIEKRATLDLRMRYKSTLLDNVGLIDTANITGNDDSTAGSYVIEASNVL